MVIRDAFSSVEISLRELGPRGTPADGDLGLDVATTGITFAGRNDTVWIGRDDWARFLQDVRALERTRSGEARVGAMSPNEFELSIITVDRAGHIAAEGWVGREYVTRTGVLHDRVHFAVDIDPTDLPRLVSDLAAIARPG